MIVGKYKVSWNHVNSGKDEKGVTQCMIEGDSTTMINVVIGIAIKHKGDNYDKNKGRYISFKRAVERKTVTDEEKYVSIFTKEERKAFWDALKETCPNVILKGSKK